MSVTTVLVPVDEDEARRLLTGEPVPELLPRAQRLRSRVDAVDAVREDLHEALYAGWEHAQAAAEPRPGLLAAIGRRLKPAPADGRLPSGYDPYVHLFGRSLPVAGDTPAAAAERLARLLEAGDAEFARGIQEELRQLGATAPRVNDPGTPPVLEPLLQQVHVLHAALQAHPGNTREAWDALLRTQAWSRPVWRLDGELLIPFLTMLGVTPKPEAATELFTEAGVEAADLPAAIPSFSGGGGYIPAASVKPLAATLRFQARLVQTARKAAEDPAQALRHLRLFSEAVFFCEAEGLGLAEGAGVEWHDRPKTA